MKINETILQLPQQTKQVADWATLKLFAEHPYGFFDENGLYIAYFGYLPNQMCARKINFEKANAWLIENYSSEINDSYSNLSYSQSKSKTRTSNAIYFLFNDVLISFDNYNEHVKILYRNTPHVQVKNVFDSIVGKFATKPTGNKKEVLLLISNSFGIETKSMQINKPKFDINSNYNNDFKPIHNIISARLKKNNDKGLIILHGKPGTGKTSYIRHLITTINKSVIFLPPNMAQAILNPDLISVLIDNPNSIFVIEDAENIVIDREKEGASPVSALLNIADGLLSDCLNIQIICSFNTDISRVDNALLRKGRLIAKYEFTELTVEKAQYLSDKLGFKNTITQPQTLSNIYNQHEIAFEQATKNTIGFMKS